MILELPLPPSINTSHINIRGGRMRINKPGTVAWYNGAVLMIQNWMQLNKIEQFDSWVYCDLTLYLPRRGADSHNYLKIYLDALQMAGLVKNDSLVMPRVQDVQFDKANPRILATFTIKNV